MWNLIANMGGSRYQLVSQTLSINGIIGGGDLPPVSSAIFAPCGGGRSRVVVQPASSNLWTFLQKENPEKVNKI